MHNNLSIGSHEVGDIFTEPWGIKRQERGDFYRILSKKGRCEDTIVMVGQKSKEKNRKLRKGCRNKAKRQYKDKITV